MLQNIFVGFACMAVGKEILRSFSARICPLFSTNNKNTEPILHVIWIWMVRYSNPLTYLQSTKISPDSYFPEYKAQRHGELGQRTRTILFQASGVRSALPVENRQSVFLTHHIKHRQHSPSRPEISPQDLPPSNQPQPYPPHPLKPINITTPTSSRSPQTQTPQILPPPQIPPCPANTNGSPSSPTSPTPFRTA